MFRKKNKVQLSPKLKLGVGRAYSQSQLFKYSGVIFLVISAALVLNTVRYFYKDSSQSNNAPQVLGDQNQVEFVDYKVAAGDTIFNIADKHKIDWTTLVTLNNLNPAVKLKVGQVLKVPKQ